MAAIHTLDERTTSLLAKSYPQADVSERDPVKLSSSIFADAQYSAPEKTEIEQWVITSSHIASISEDAAKNAERLSSLNTHLSTRTTLLGSKPSIADLVVYARLSPVIAGWTPEQRTGEQGYHHIVRHLDFVQNAPTFNLKLSDAERVNIDPSSVIYKIKPIDAKAEKERKKKEKELAAAAAAAVGAGSVGQAKAANAAETIADKAKSVGDKLAAAAAAAGGGEEPTKKQKKEKAPKKSAAAPAVEKPLSPCLIDLRVGHILKAIQHPNADSLYVSTIAVGDPPGTDNTSEHEGQICRTVCSGLNGLVPLEEMQGRKIVAVCNLKPVTMRGIKSAAMVLAASPRLPPGAVDDHAGPVELVNVPAASVAGERVYFEGWTDSEPEVVLNPKKKIWESIQPGFTTTADLQVGFDATGVEQLREKATVGEVARLRTKDGLCTVKSLTGAVVR